MHRDTEKVWLSPPPAEPLAEPVRLEQEPSLVAPLVGAAAPAPTNQQLPPTDEDRLVSLPDVDADRMDALPLAAEALHEEPLPVFEDLEPLDELAPLDELLSVEDLVPPPEPDPANASRADETAAPMEETLTASTTTPHVTATATQDEDLDEPDASGVSPAPRGGGAEEAAHPAPVDEFVFPALVLQPIEVPASDSLQLAPVATEESPVAVAVRAAYDGLATPSIQPPAENAVGSTPDLPTAPVSSGKAASSRLRSLQARLDALKTPS